MSTTAKKAGCKGAESRLVCRYASTTRTILARVQRKDALAPLPVGETGGSKGKGEGGEGDHPACTSLQGAEGRGNPAPRA